MPAAPDSNDSPLRWYSRAFSELSVVELYALLRLRGEVFVVEQECAYLDPDGLDPAAWHYMGWDGDELVASQRCLPPGTPYAESSIGRIVTAPARRGRNFGRELVARGIAFNREQWPGHPIRIGAQSRLAHFYESYGFHRVGDPYMEDGIEHVHMLLDD
jgi:ElaA protein